MWILALSWAAIAVGQEFDLYGFNPRAIGMGNVQTAAEGDFSAVYYNPALLCGGTVARPFLQSTQVSPSPPGQRLDVGGLTATSGYTLGFSAPIGGIVKDRATVGFGMFLLRQPLPVSPRGRWLGQLLPLRQRAQPVPDPKMLGMAIGQGLPL